MLSRSSFLEQEDDDESLSLGEIVMEEFRLTDVLGAGTFGVIYEASHVRTKKRVAVKVGNANAPPQQLKTEYGLYSLLHDLEVIVPRVYKIGAVRGSRLALVMDLLGPSLQDLFDYFQCSFPISTVAHLAVHMIERLAAFHQITGYVHRDIKPNNFALGLTRNVVHLIDFGLAKPYLNQTNGRHLPFARKPQRFVGTLRYASCNTHRGKMQSRRDDMISLGYTLVYFTRGSLPWQSVRSVSHAQKAELIMEMKMRTSVAELCAGLPQEFAAFLSHCQELRFSKEPNYIAMMAMFNQLGKQHGEPHGDLTFLRTPPRAITKRTQREDHRELQN